MSNKQTVTPRAVWQEYESGRRFKSGLGPLGLYEQNRRNERFFVGDQWHGAKCGGERPLVRHNVIKRIGDYKMAVVGAAPLAVAFSAEGVPNTAELRECVRERREALRGGEGNTASVALRVPPSPRGEGFDQAVDIDLVMSALSDYFKATAERTKLDDKKAQVLEDAYISGTGYLHTYWDADVETGLYADMAHTTPIKGDIAVETLDVENVYMGDPMTADVQSQPYILIVQRKSVGELRRLARRNGVSATMIEDITPDTELSYMAGDRSMEEPGDTKKATVITRLWKCRDENGLVTVKAIQVCKDVVIRREWDLGVRVYPIAAFTWQKRKNCAYGDSEITHLIPNQIAINRMLTASVWAVMMMGVPMTVVNGDVVSEDITNDPGQVLRVYGSAEEVASAVRYVEPPQFSPKFDEIIQSLISNTLMQSGANDAALGDIKPDNTSAILAVREAALLPMQLVQNRYYSFVEDVARIWAEFWIRKYGERQLKIEDDGGVWYLPFNGEHYSNIVINTRIDVGSTGLWSESQTMATLNHLLAEQVITPLQYIKRLPRGVVPHMQELIREMQEAGGDAEPQESLRFLQDDADALQERGADVSDLIDPLSPDQRELLVSRMAGGE